MDWHAEWTKAQHDLSVVSRNYQRWQMLPSDRRRLLGRDGYRAKCKAARLAVKEADQRCRSLLLDRRHALGMLGPAVVE